ARGALRRHRLAPPPDARARCCGVEARLGGERCAGGAARRAAVMSGDTVGTHMKVYRGGRSLDGAVVTVDGKPLPPRYDLKRLSATGFEWTYEGAGPAQLALALLADHLADDKKALALYERFMRRVVAELDKVRRRRLDDVAGAHDQRQAERTQDLAAEIADAVAQAHAAAAQPGRPDLRHVRSDHGVNGAAEEAEGDDQHVEYRPGADK